MEIDEDDEYAPSPEEIAAEEEEEPLMMQNAEAWDDFLDYVNLLQMDWAAPEEDTDLYRKRRAVEFFNAGEPACARRLQIWSDCVCACAGNKVANHLIRMKPTLESWVPHVMCFIVPRQVLTLGDPSRRSCDACEAFGAWLKRTIKEKTCRRRLKAGPTEHVKKDPATKETLARWKQHFRRGYIEQAFTRGCVKERLGHGEENLPYLQREDWKRIVSGKTHIKYDRKEVVPENGDTPAQPRNLKDILAEVAMPPA